MPPHSNYVPTTVRRLGIMLRIHRRHAYLKKIFANFKRLGSYREVYLAIQADRPSPKVAELTAKLVGRLPKNFTVDVFEAPQKLVERRENFMTALQTHYEFLLDMAQGRLDAAILWDDDFWLDKGGLRELSGHMDILEADRIEIKSDFLWNDTHTVNRRFPDHWQAFLFRVLPGDQFPTDYIVHCPHGAASGRSIRMRSRLQNAGYLDPVDRELTWKAYKEAGKIDRHTLSLVREPELETVDGADA